MGDIVDFNTQVSEEAEQLDQLQEGDSLINRGMSDVLDEGYTASEWWSVGQGFGSTFAEMYRGKAIEQRTRQEQPEVVRDDTPWNPDGEERQVGRERAGRLMRVQGSGGEDTPGADVGFSGGAANVEEAAIHIIRNDQDEDDDFRSGTTAAGPSSPKSQPVIAPRARVSAVWLPLPTASSVSLTMCGSLGWSGW